MNCSMISYAESFLTNPIVPYDRTCTHGASDRARKACGPSSVFVLEQNAFDDLSVEQFDREFRGSVSSVCDVNSQIHV
jgi:hypothetical protein